MQPLKSRFCSRSRRLQRGDILLESLIGIVLMSIVGLGMVYATGRVATSQKDMNLQNLVVSQMRELLKSRGETLCPSGTEITIEVPSAPSGQVVLESVCQNGPTSLTVGSDTFSVSAPARWVALETKNTDSNTALFGGVIRVGDAGAN